MAFAAPIAAEAAEAGAGRAAAGAAASKAPKGGAAAGGAPSRGSWRERAAEGAGAAGGGGGKAKGGAAKGGKYLKGDAGKWRRLMIGEFLICVMLLALSPLAKGSGEMGPVRFMKRGSATCALFIILGMVSAGGRGAAKAAAMFGALVTLVLLVDQREAFGKLAKTLNASKDADAGDAAATAATQGPDDSTALPEDNPGVFNT